MTKSDLRREVVLFLAYPFLELAILILRFLPKTWRNHLGTFIGGLSYKWNEKTRTRTLASPTTAYGDTKSPAEIEGMARDVIENISKSVLDYRATAHITKPDRFLNSWRS